MTDEVQKIKDWINKEQEGLMDAQGNFEYPEHQGAYDVLCNLDAYIDSLQEEPVSKDFETALAEMVDKAQKCVVEPWVVAAQWKDELIRLAKSEEPVSEKNLSNVERTLKEWKEPVSEDLEEAVNAYIGYAPEVDESPSVYGKRQAFKVGAKWQKQQIWKKVCEWLKCLNDTHYIMHYSDSQEATLEELKDWFKHYMEE